MLHVSLGAITCGNFLYHTSKRTGMNVTFADTCTWHWMHYIIYSELTVIFVHFKTNLGYIFLQNRINISLSTQYIHLQCNLSLYKYTRWTYSVTLFINTAGCNYLTDWKLRPYEIWPYFSVIRHTYFYIYRFKCTIFSCSYEMTRTLG